MTFGLRPIWDEGFFFSFSPPFSIPGTFHGSMCLGIIMQDVSLSYCFDCKQQRSYRTYERGDTQQDVASSRLCDF